MERKRKFKAYLLKIRSLQSGTSGSSFWTKVRAARQRNKPITADPVDSAAHIETVVGSLPTLDSTVDIPLPEQPYTPHADEYFEESEIEAVIASMKAAAPGSDGVTKKVLNCMDIKEITAFFREITESGKVPQSWRYTIIVPVPKAGRPTDDPKNLRPISLQPTLRKVYNCCLVNRYYAWLELNSTVLPDSQNGFRPGRRTTDNLLVLRVLHERCTTTKRPLHVVAMDIQQAFDCVDIPTLFTELNRVGFRGRHVAVLREMYLERMATVRFGDRYSAPFEIHRGVGQGDPPSPPLFTTYLAKTKAPHPDDPTLVTPVQGELCSVSEIIVADDLTHLCTTVEGSQKKIDERTTQCEKLGLHMAAGKGAHLILGDFSAAEDKPLQRGNRDGEIPRVEAFRLNGFQLVQHKQWQASADKTLSHHMVNAAGALHHVMSIQKDAAVSSIWELWTLYKSLVITQFNYAAEICPGYSETLEREIDHFHRNSVRRIFGVQPKVMSHTLFHDLAAIDLSHRLTILTLKYTRHLLSTNSPTLRNTLLTTLYHCNYFNYGWLWDLKTSVARQFRLTRFDTRSLETLSNSLEATIVLAERAAQTSINTKYQNNLKTSSRQQCLAACQIPKSNLSYLHALLPYGQAIAKFRVSSHRLQIERGRIGPTKTQRSDRFCPHCFNVLGLRELEDERHVIFQCSDHIHDRTTAWRLLGITTGETDSEGPQDTALHLLSSVNFPLPVEQEDSESDQQAVPGGLVNEIRTDGNQTEGGQDMEAGNGARARPMTGGSGNKAKQTAAESVFIIRWLSEEDTVKILGYFLDPQSKEEANITGSYLAKVLKRIDKRYIN